MGRNKFAGPLSKREKKLKEEGKFHLRPDGHTLTDGYFSQGEPQHKRRMVAVDTRRPAQSNNSWVHAILFVVFAAIVVSWALGY